MFDTGDIFTQALTLAVIVRMHKIGMPAMPQSVGCALNLLHHVAGVDTIL